MNQKTKNLIKGIVLVAVPICIIFVVGYYYVNVICHSVQLAIIPGIKSFGGITIDHPPVGFFDKAAQLLVGLGLCLSSICWGVSTIIKALRS